MKNKNPVVNWWNNLKNTKSNYQKVRASPYASLTFALKVRKIILIPLMIYLAYRGYDMIINYNARGFMGTFGKVIMFGIFAYLIYKIYRTIPDAKRQIEYYRKYPHVINYCPTNVKEDVDDIINKIKENEKELKEKKEVSKNVQKEKATRNTTTSPRSAS